MSVFFKARRWQETTSSHRSHLPNYTFYLFLAHLLPFNTGEIARIKIFKNSKNSYSELAGNVFLERIYDFISFSILTSLMLIYYQDAFLINSFKSLGLIVIILITIIIFLPRFFPKMLHNFLKISHFHAGFLFKKKYIKKHIIISLLTIIIRLISILSIYYTIQAVNLNLAFKELIFSSLLVYIFTSLSFHLSTSTHCRWLQPTG